MMTEKDRALIERAQYAGTDHGFIDSLIPEADTEECRRELREISHWAFKREESRAYDHHEHDEGGYDRDYCDDYDFYN